jgi:acetyl esterase
VAVAGDSAGATLAAVVCQRARRLDGPSLALQVLFCPVTDLSRRSESWTAYGQGFFLERATLDWAVTQYCPPGTDLADTRISPLRAADLSGLPPAHIHTAEFDPLRDEGKAYADALVHAGVPVHYICHEGMIHHFYCMAGAISYAQPAIARAGAAIGEALS